MYKWEPYRSAQGEFFKNAYLFPGTLFTYREEKTCLLPGRGFVPLVPSYQGSGTVTEETSILSFAKFLKSAKQYVF